MLHLYHNKGAVFVIGVFKKYKMSCSNGNHLVLLGHYNPGVIGTIIRSASGFEQKNIVIIDDAVKQYKEGNIKNSLDVESYLDSLLQPLMQKLLEAELDNQHVQEISKISLIIHI